MGTTNYDVTNNINQRQSSGISGDPNLMIKDYEDGYQKFINSVLSKSTSLDLPFLNDAEIIFLESSKYSQKLSEKPSSKGRLENFILNFFQTYFHNAFYKPLIKEVTQEIQKMTSFKPESIIFGRNRNLLVFGATGSLYKFTFQICVGYVRDFSPIQEESKELSLVNSFGLYFGVSLVNVKDKSLVNDALHNVEQFLSAHSLKLSDTLKEKFQLLHENNEDSMKKYSQLQEEKNESGWIKAAKIGVDITKTIAPKLLEMLSNYLQDKQQAQVNQGAKLNAQFNKLWLEEKPDTYASPLWRVGQIIASYTKIVQDKEIKTTVTFTGTVIDSYAILTSANALLRKRKEDPQSKLESLQIKLPKEAHTRKISISNMNNQASQNSHCFLFLQHPLVQDIIHNYNFELKYIKDMSTSFHISCNKIYMCGYLENGNQFHQSSNVINFDYYYLIEAFRKNDLSIGAPIYYFLEEDNNYTYNLIGLNHANMSLDDSRINNQTLSEQVASQFLQMRWFKQAYYKGKIAEAQFKYNAAQAKEKINKQQPLPLQNQSIMDQILNKTIELPSPLHSVGIIEIKNNFQTSYAVGILFKQNQLLTLTKYTGDKTKNIAVYIKKFARFSKLDLSQRRTLTYDLLKRDDFDIYVVVGQKISKDKDLSILELKPFGGTPVVQNFTRLINNQALQYFENLSAISLGINKKSTRGHKVVLEMDLDLYPHQILQTYTEDKHNNKSVDGGLIFAHDNIQVQYCYGFYEKPKAEDRKGSKGTFTFFGASSVNMNEAISLRDLRNKMGQELLKEKPYSHTAILLSIDKKDNSFVIGTCSLLQSKRQKIFAITCAHNLVYTKGKQIYTMEEQLKNIRLVFGSTQEISWNFDDIEKIYNNVSDKMVKKVHIHPKYIQKLKESLQKKSFTKDQDKYRPQYFYDIAVLEIDLPQNNEEKLQNNEQEIVSGFVIKKSPFSINYSNIRDVEVAGYPAKENIYSSRFGILYSEAVRYHRTQYQPECYKIISQGNKDQTIIQHKLSTLSGNSGSPVFIPIHVLDKHVLLGIHIAGIYRTEQVFNLATYIYNKEVLNWLIKDVQITEALID